MTKKESFFLNLQFIFIPDSFNEYKNNQVSIIHNPIPPFTVPTCIKLRPLSKVYVSVQQDVLMSIYKIKRTKKKKNIQQQ